MLISIVFISVNPDPVLGTFEECVLRVTPSPLYHAFAHLLLFLIPLIHHFLLPLLRFPCFFPLPRPSPPPYRGWGEGSIAWAHHRACSWRSSHVSAFCLIFLFYITWQLFPTGDGLPFACCSTLCAHTYMCVREFSACMHVCLLACERGCFSMSSSSLPAPFAQTCLFAVTLPLLQPSSFPDLFLSAFPPPSIARANKAIKA